MQAFLKTNFGFPFQDGARARDIGLALLWVADTARIFDKTNAPGLPVTVDRLCKLEDSHFVLIATLTGDVHSE
jgi:hypothetical protein